MKRTLSLLAALAALAGAVAMTPGRSLAAVTPTVHGLLDAVLTGNNTADDMNVLWLGDTRFDTYSTRLFVDAVVTDRIQVFTQTLLTETPGVRPMGAYAMIDPWKGRDVHVVAGLIPYFVGTFETRSYSDKNPLVGIPMLYQHHTTLRWDQFPANADELLGSAGQGFYGVSFPAGGYAFAGMPVIYQHWWDFGVGVMGSARPLEFALALENGTPSWPTPTREENAGKGVLGRVGLAPSPGIRFGVSGAYGPYVSDYLSTPLPPGKRPQDYNQILVMADAEWSAGHVDIRSEVYKNGWETPTLGTLDVAGGYVEAKVTLPAGLYAAGRYEIMRFEELADSTGARRSWDTDWDRGEAGLGYRAARNVIVKAVYQWNVAQTPTTGGVKDRTDVLAAQLSVRF